MNRLVIIGNGFDMAHGLKTSYMDFINWYWDQRVNTFVGNTTKVSEDILCKSRATKTSVVGIFSHFKTHFSLRTYTIKKDTLDLKLFRR